MTNNLLANNGDKESQRDTAIETEDEDTHTRTRTILSEQRSCSGGQTDASST